MSHCLCKAVLFAPLMSDYDCRWKERTKGNWTEQMQMLKRKPPKRNATGESSLHCSWFVNTAASQPTLAGL